MLIAVPVVSGCHSRRPDFMTRVREDCSAGQQWACDLFGSLNKQPPMYDVKQPVAEAWVDSESAFHAGK